MAMLVIAGLFYLVVTIESITDKIPFFDKGDINYYNASINFGLFSVSLISLILFIKKNKWGFYLSHIVSLYGVFAYGLIFAVFIIVILSGVLEYPFELMITAFLWMGGIFVNNLLLLIAAWKSRSILKWGQIDE